MKPPATLLSRRNHLLLLGRSLGMLPLLQTWVARAASAPSAPVAPFVLPHFAGGPEFRSLEARGKFVALHFLLKTECPVCLRHTRTHLQRAAELPDVRQVFIKPDTDAEIQQWARELPKDMPLYRDADAMLATRFKIPDGYAFHGQTVHYPALVLLDPQGREVFRHVGRNNTDRLDFDRLASTVKSLR